MPSPYNPELAPVICERVAQGESLRAICREPGMPAEGDVRRWAIANTEDFGTQYARSRDIGLDCEVEEALAIARDLSTPVDRARLIVDTIKWRACKMAPKRYGDSLKLRGDPDEPITVKRLIGVDLSEL